MELPEAGSRVRAGCEVTDLRTTEQPEPKLSEGFVSSYLFVRASLYRCGVDIDRWRERIPSIGGP